MGGGDRSKDHKIIADSYGICVRAGAITPQKDDEQFFREINGIPAMSSEVESAWREDGGVRRPVTLKAGDVFAAEGEQITDSGGKDNGQEKE